MGVIDYDSKLGAIKTALDTANATGATYELFTNMSGDTPIVTISKHNPSVVNFGATDLPAITIELDSADLEYTDMRPSPRKEATLNIVITGMVYDNQVSRTEDVAAKELGYLMENIEQVLRSDPQVSNTFIFSQPKRVQFYDIMGEEEAFRVAQMDYEAKCKY